LEGGLARGEDEEETLECVRVTRAMKFTELEEFLQVADAFAHVKLQDGSVSLECGFTEEQRC
jgi:hypothetical protein